MFLPTSIFTCYSKQLTIPHLSLLHNNNRNLTPRKTVNNFSYLESSFTQLFKCISDFPIRLNTACSP